MPIFNNVSDSFQALIKRIQPINSEIRVAKSSFAGIKSRLEKTFKLKRFGLIGSYSRKTAIKRFSDVDYLAVVSRDDVRWGESYKDSRTLIRKVAETLRYRYPQTKIR